MEKKQQIEILNKEKSSYGGELMKTRKGREKPRPITTRSTMHVVLRSSRARGDWSFNKPKHDLKIQEITKRFADKYGVQIISLANVGNHLHYQIKLKNRNTYKPFIRAITAAISMAVSGASRWKKSKKADKNKFWDYRPFSRIVEGEKVFLTLKDYLEVNEVEGFSAGRDRARFMIKDWKKKPSARSSN